MTFEEDLSPFCEKDYGFVSILPNPPAHSTDNGLLFSATALQFENLVNPRIKTLNRGQFHALERACQVVPGIYNRYPDDRSLNSHDDLTGVAFAAWKLGLPYAREILQHGRSHSYSWNNVNPSKWTLQTFFGRFPGFVAFLKSAAGEKLNLFDQILFAIGCWASTRAPHADTSGKCLDWLKIQPVRGKGRISDWAIRRWQNEMRLMYPGGLQELYGIYFSHPEHPFRNYAQRNFDF